MPDAERPKSPLTLSVAERTALSQLATTPQTSAAMHLRTRIMLANTENRSNKTVADLLEITPKTIGKWRRRFLRMDMAGLDNKMRNGRPQIINQIQLNTITTKSMANSRQRASTRELAAAYGVSQSTITHRHQKKIQHFQSEIVVGSSPAAPPFSSDPKLLSDRIYKTIHNWILSSKLAPKIRMIESEIARVLNTSQTPTQKTIQRLAHKKLVTYRPQLKNFVTEISQVETREAREVHVLLESTAARQTTGHMPPKKLDLLRIEIQRMSEAADHHDIGGFQKTNLHFHRQMLATSENSMLLRVWRTLEPAL